MLKDILLNEFDKEFTNSDPGGRTDGGMYPTDPIYEWATEPKDVRSFLSSAINRVLDAALEAMPKKKDVSIVGNTILSYDEYNAALNDTREKILALKRV